MNAKAEFNSLLAKLDYAKVSQSKKVITVTMKNGKVYSGTSDDLIVLFRDMVHPKKKVVAKTPYISEPVKEKPVWEKAEEI